MLDLLTTTKGVKVTALATSSYAAFNPRRGVPVQTSIGRPRFPLDYELREQISELMPSGLLKVSDDATFTRLYRERLDALDFQALLAQFDAISKRNDHKRLVLLCFEDVHAGEFCHRRVFAEWYKDRAGRLVPELGEGGIVHLSGGEV